ncbi:MAG: glycoside hydrolase family 25 protein [Lachnospiraceae bacterium]|nr:glycoside hydrolase family 25 protein [Lachnospiraceae bacterium]
MTNTQDYEKIRRKKKLIKRKKIRMVINTIVAMLLITSIVLGGYYYRLYRIDEEMISAKNKEIEELNDRIANDTYSEEDIRSIMSDSENNAKQTMLTYIRNTFESGEGALTVLENLYPNNIIVPDSGVYRFFEIKNYRKSDNKENCFVYPVKNEENGSYEGRASYEDGEMRARLGVDVSKFQGTINWNRVKNDGIEYAYIRLGYRGYESGKIVNDSMYEVNIKKCNAVGLDCGVYFFTEAKTEEEAVEEAEFVLESLADYHIELPIVIDVEESANISKSRTKNLTKEQRTKNVIAFCDRIREAGYEAMIYGNLKSMMVMMDFEQLEDYDKWFAYYRYPIRFPYRYRIWQYSSTGSVDGIKGQADMNLMFY